MNTHGIDRVEQPRFLQSEEYQQGRKDCESGSNPTADSDAYLSGYADQYAIEQASTYDERDNEKWAFQY